MSDHRLERERDFHNRRFSGDDGARAEAGVGRFYDAVDNARHYYTSTLRRMSAGKDILELGCARGEVLRSLPAFRSAIGIDISDTAVKIGNSLTGARPIQLVSGDAHATALPSASFDFVFGSGIIHHLDTQNSVLEVSRLLRPGGAAFFAEPLGHNPIINWFRDQTPEARTADEHPLMASDLALFRNTFAAVDLKCFGFFAIAAGFPGLRWSKSLGQQMDTALLSVPGLRLQAWQVMIHATKAS